MKNKKIRNDKMMKILERIINIQSNIVNFLILKPLDIIFKFVDKFDKQILMITIISLIGMILFGVVLLIFGCTNKNSTMILDSLLMLIMGTLLFGNSLEFLYDRYKSK